MKIIVTIESRDGLPHAYLEGIGVKELGEIVARAIADDMENKNTVLMQPFTVKVKKSEDGTNERDNF